MLSPNAADQYKADILVVIKQVDGSKEGIEQEGREVVCTKVVNVN